MRQPKGKPPEARPIMPRCAECAQVKPKDFYLFVSPRIWLCEECAAKAEENKRG